MMLTHFQDEVANASRRSYSVSVDSCSGIVLSAHRTRLWLESYDRASQHHTNRGALPQMLPLPRVFGHGKKNLVVVVVAVRATQDMDLHRVPTAEVLPLCLGRPYLQS